MNHRSQGGAAGWLGGMESICPPAHRARARLGFIPAAGTHGIPTLWGFKGFFPPPWCRLQENQALSPLHLMCTEVPNPGKAKGSPPGCREKGRGWHPPSIAIIRRLQNTPCVHRLRIEGWGWKNSKFLLLDYQQTASCRADSLKQNNHYTTDC